MATVMSCASGLVVRQQTARVQVQCSDNIFFDISAANFVILSDDIFRDGFN